ncbi:MAG: hypothetical protein M9928_00180 [Anaerolineae bacterium]|nr:hypothetical protein [Anaerolineae bacterium]MCO5203427.1 hypothetical protein [Anaerolineae bacterium]
MNKATQWRFELAQRIASAYAAIPAAEVVMIAGSTGRGTADRYSDIEIDVYYSAWPTLTERQTAVAACGGESAEFSTFAESEIELAESMFFNGFYVHTSTFLSQQMEQWVQRVTIDGDPDVEGQMRMNSVRNAVAVTGHEQARRWQQAAQAYPDALVERMLTDNLDFEQFYYLADMVVYRDDTLLLNKTLLQCATQILQALHGLNRVYLPTPDALKWMDETIGVLAIKPEQLGCRLRQMFRVDSAEAVAIMRSLIGETQTLIAQHLPQFDLSRFAASNAQIRQPFDKMP